MLKITTIDSGVQRKLILAGRIVEPWAAELNRAWEHACDSLGGRKLAVDLTDVTVISREGTHVLHEMMNHGVEFICRGVYVSHVVRNLKTLCRAQAEQHTHEGGT
jgi:anti-anti-sigma regulatory factor